MLAAHFAVPMAGAIINTINTRLDAETVSYILEHCEVRRRYENPSFAPDTAFPVPA